MWSDLSVRVSLKIIYWLSQECGPLCVGGTILITVIIVMIAVSAKAMFSSLFFVMWFLGSEFNITQPEVGCLI